MLSTPLPDPSIARVLGSGRITHDEVSLVYDTQTGRHVSHWRSYYSRCVVPAIHHEVMLRSMERFLQPVVARQVSTYAGSLRDVPSVNGFSHQLGERERRALHIPLGLEPPVLRRQVAGSIRGHRVWGEVGYLRPQRLRRQYGGYLWGSGNPRESREGSSHGSITETDDLAAPAHHYHVRRRVNLNNRGAARRGGPRVVQDGPDVEGPMDDPGRERQLEVIINTIVRSTHPDALYTTNGVDILPGLPEGWIAVDSRPGMTCKHSGHGWAQTSNIEGENKQVFDGMPATMLCAAKGYSRKDKLGNWMEFAGGEFWVYRPLLSRLRKYLPSRELNAPIVAAMEAFVQRYCQEYSNHPVIRSTVQYCLHTMDDSSGDTLGNSYYATRIANNAEEVAYGDLGRLSIMASLGVQVENHRVLQLPSVAYDAPLDWDIRQDVKILKARGVVYMNGLAVRKGRIEDHIRFTGVEPRRHYRSAYFRFLSPDLRNMEEFAPTNENYARALFRLLKTEDGDCDLRNNALLLGRALAASQSGTCSGDVQAAHATLLNGRHMRENDELGGVHGYIVNGMKKVFTRCHKTFLDQVIVDPALNLARMARWGFVEKTAWTYEEIFSTHLSFLAPIPSRVACASIAHAKAKLRRRYVERHIMDTDDVLMMGKPDEPKVTVCLKRESANKPRLTADYKAGCMYANELPEAAKRCIDGTYHFERNGWSMVVYVMAKPKSDSLEKIFTDFFRLSRAPKLVYVAIFSDDAITNLFDLDISRCDSRQDSPAFLAAYLCMRRFHKERAHGLLRQCMVPMQLHNGDVGSSVVVQFDGPFLGSGTVLTSLLNHLVLVMISLGALYHLSEGLEAKQAFVRGAAACGHVLTFDENHGNPPEMTWLRKSGHVVDGRVIPWTNLGCILKNFGTVWDDLECRHLGVDSETFRGLSMERRMDMFFSRVITGWKHEPGNIVMDALRERFRADSDVEILTDSNKFLFVDRTDYSQFDVTDSVCQRYACTRGELVELAEAIRHLRLGQFIVCPVLEKIYRRDNGSKELALDGPFATSAQLDYYVE